MLLAVSGVLVIVFAAVWVNARSAGGPNAQNPAGKTPPKVTFAEGVRSGNAGLDDFIQNFIEVCLRGDYDQYRLCWTAYSPPISSSQFRTIWDMAEHIVITRIASLPGKARGKAYLVKASATLNPRAKVQHKDVELLVLWEDGKWVIAPAPHSQPQQQDLQPLATESAATQPAKG